MKRKIIIWNINQHNNYKNAHFIPPIVADSVNNQADIIILTEFYKTKKWIEELGGKLSEYNVFSSDNLTNQILIAMKKDINIKGETAAEVIYHRADAEKDFMGLMTFLGEQPKLREAKVAKNYLDEKELRAMGQLVSGYLDFAERQAEREIPMTMEDWAKHLDGILTLTGENLLTGNGSVSHLQTMEKAQTEYKKYKAKTISSVEKDYLESIKLLEQKGKQ